MRAVPQGAVPPEFYGNLVADAHAGGTKTIVDLSPPALNSALEGSPDFVKLSTWQLGQFIEDEANEPEHITAGARRVLDAGAGCVMVTRGGDPALIMTSDRTWELIPPRFSRGAPEGSGDSMVGALAAMLARGRAHRGRAALGSSRRRDELPAPRTRHRLAGRGVRSVPARRAARLAKYRGGFAAT